jgi:methionyl-tRNA formyltransferase
VRVLPGALREVILGRARLVSQDPSKATYAPVLRKKDGEILWELSAEEIRNRIRGLDPWPGAYTFWKGKRLRLWKAVAEQIESPGFPGELLGVSEQGMRVASGKGVLCVTSLQLEGGRRMTVEEFLRGHGLKGGERLG